MSDRSGDWRRRDAPDRRSYRRDHAMRGDPYERPESLDYGSEDSRGWRAGASRRDEYDDRGSRERWRRDAGRSDDRRSYRDDHRSYDDTGRERRTNDKYSSYNRDRSDAGYDRYKGEKHSSYARDRGGAYDRRRGFRDDPYTQPREERWVPPPREERWDDDRDAPEEEERASEKQHDDEPRNDNVLPPADDDEAQMAAMMGFGSFGTSKGKPVDGNDVGYAHVKKERTWRQYMNRKGGFNRPLDKI
ncbi:hypothetical protein MCUN1_002756 [Malassezia cuniculi]|uniref:U4/U6.U5 small nuclear ribonucleoprotein 27kDa protein domain-containing protein n=1 Tax=Malassezia cuniculi TaxID=948313 RepID=A0AAF0F0A4_9BASI|nr:hypothetical protein MCUN1_002756 [Malassezia cuniculi]